MNFTLLTPELYSGVLLLRKITFCFGMLCSECLRNVRVEMSCWQLHKWMWSLKETCGLETGIWESFIHRWLNTEVKSLDEIIQGTESNVRKGQDYE